MLLAPQTVTAPDEAYVNSLEKNQHVPACITIENVLESLDHTELGSVEVMAGLFKVFDDDDVTLLASMMSLDNTKRISARDVLAHPCMLYLDEPRCKHFLQQTWKPIVVPLDEVDEEQLRLADIKEAVAKQVRASQASRSTIGGGGCSCAVS